MTPAQHFARVSAQLEDEFRAGVITWETAMQRYYGSWMLALEMGVDNMIRPSEWARRMTKTEAAHGA